MVARRIGGGNAQATRYGYDDANRMTTTTLPSGTGVVSSYSYDNADRLTAISHVKGLADHYDQIVPLM